jgi:acetyl esterase
VVSLDYRLAPEHRFPTAVHDSRDALNWLHQNGQTLGLDTDRLAVGGDSAGGTLSAVCALMARDAGLKLALQLLFYPGCGGRQDTPSHHTFAEGFMLDKANADNKNPKRYPPVVPMSQANPAALDAKTGTPMIPKAK